MGSNTWILVTSSLLNSYNIITKKLQKNVMYFLCNITVIVVSINYT
jgi:hypothetical protein